MSSKRAIIIVILFIIIVIFFIIFKKQVVSPSPDLNNQAGKVEVKKEPVKPEENVEDKVDKIIEEAKNNPNSTPDTVRRDIISTINNGIIKFEENKTPEQKEADLKAQIERQRIIDEINSKIRQTQ